MTLAPQVIESEGSPPFFNNKTTGETTWDHPLQVHLEELSALALRCLALKPTERWQASGPRGSRGQQVEGNSAMGWLKSDQ
eukprot:Skav217342  [mRNA]  locus=scaffold1410:319264:322161:- [translate_table: standard]